MECDKQVPHGHVGKAPELHDCGYPVDSFACKIRHLEINTGDAKAGKDVGGRQRHVDITPTGRVVR
jgi:hypothetical protein